MKLVLWTPNPNHAIMFFYIAYTATFTSTSVGFDFLIVFWQIARP
jgi:hypothetical protein